MEKDLSIEEGNKIIAKFLGWKYHSAKQNWEHSRIDWASWTDLEKVGHKVLMFHSSWDWLMPVVEKCLFKCGDNPTQETYILSELSGVQIKDIWKAVVSFIQWYNTTKHNQP